MTPRDRKRRLKASYKAQERVLEAGMPLPKDGLLDLFAYLDRRIHAGCDHTLRQTQQFLRTRDFDASSVLPWLRQNGGFCDCEVLINVADKYGPIIGYEV